MGKGKPWAVEEERKLRELLKSGASVKAVAAALGKTEAAVQQKMFKLNLKEEKIVRGNVFSSSKLKLPEDLPSVEEQLRVLAGALDALKAPGLGQADVLRLRSIIQGVKVYKELFADYVDYRGIEQELVEWKEKYAALAKKVEGLQGK